MKEGSGKKRGNLQGSFVTGAIALVFLIIGYQVALFIHKAAVMRIAANQDHPDTVYVVDEALARRVLDGTSGLAGEEVMTGTDQPSQVIVRKESSHTPAVKALRERKVESFPFNPNTIGLEDLQRLGFSEKQAQSILHYREKGGRFLRKADFAKSFVVADSVYARLEPYIRIPLLDINKADSAAFLALPGIGPWFAGKMVSYRATLGGYSYPEQLLEIYHFDRGKFDALSDLITCSAPEPYPLWTLPEADLARHPYISRQEAHGIVLYRENNPRSACTLDGLHKAGVLSRDHFTSLSRCRIAHF